MRGKATLNGELAVSEVKKCPKWGSTDLKKESVEFPDASVGFFASLIATAYICNVCGHIEFYRE